MLSFTTNNPTTKFTNDSVHSFPVMNEPGFTYNKLPHAVDHQAILLRGYFQSYKYFENHLYNNILQYYLMRLILQLIL